MLREGTIVQDRQADRKQRYPAKGLHWLLGLVRLASGDATEALREFEREIASGSWQLYAREFAMNAHDGAGFAYLDRRRRRRGDRGSSAKRSSSFPITRDRSSASGAALSAAGDAGGSSAARRRPRRQSTHCVAAAARARR